jgi:anti-sigma regulatory factor (Ser/Thr protein kinase)
MKRSFEFSADTAVLANIGEPVIEAAHNAGFKDSEINDVQLAVDRACTNTIIHGLKEDPSRTFQLEIQWETGEIDILALH